MKNCANCSHFKRLKSREEEPYGTCDLVSMKGAIVGYPIVCDRYKKKTKPLK